MFQPQGFDVLQPSRLSLAEDHRLSQSAAQGHASILNTTFFDRTQHWQHTREIPIYATGIVIFIRAMSAAIDWQQQRERAHVPHDSALSVGAGMQMGNDAERVKELEDEIRELNQKLVSASMSIYRKPCYAYHALRLPTLTTDPAQRFADYENEIRVLQAQVRQEKRRNASQDSTADSVKSAAEKPIEKSDPKPAAAGISRFGSFMHARKTTAQTPITSPPTDSTRERELESQLITEQTQRLAAESKVKEMNAELEELTGQLFGEANRMVADEKREAARLRERIEFLEQRDAKFGMKVRGLEEREEERRRRLDVLERAQGRLERVEGLLLVPR